MIKNNSNQYNVLMIYFTSYCINREIEMNIEKFLVEYSYTNIKTEFNISGILIKIFRLV